MGAAGHRVDIEHVSQRFTDYTAVSDASLSIGAGELVALLGPSGCGKSTLLRIIAGFIRQSEGRILFDGESVGHLPASRRGVGIVFQNYALFPHMTVRQNIAYGLEARGWRRAEIEKRVDEMLARVHMSTFGERFPRQLSGGQQQRIALARCLAIDPKVLLLDEPFAALDKNLRFDMQIEVKRLQRECGITTVMVTHDQEEALSMADRIAVMSRGKLEQVAPPMEIYDHPASLFVNQFVGSTNLIEGQLINSTNAVSTIRLPDGSTMSARPDTASRPGAKVVVAVRPERLVVRQQSAEGLRAGVIKSVLPLGAHVAYVIEMRDGTYLKAVLAREALLLQPGDDVHVAPDMPSSCHVFPSTVSQS